ncbi:MULTISPECIES: transposase [Aneurinibacillus]|uniref:Transposase n=1 Tax=Aneurinibacillus thermoaerophilus TaxID=143495 RepID=A0A1G7YED1_ANETH|nr:MULTISPECIES: transposase [Aneurinibacillus]AMA72198.1 hypothetical protein ACH33_04570 [Aneurinibacillus sp. XH2]MED0676485.1 transposase [Aneurinibacillus thermoaerophilus]MED0678997.1 transposase [Aneurinibacillus thermoaerophilus]MED0736535.1 transposase [Aneurinibacillus thermoaerophilus]MED0756038.1 transposase [Aneurinibacillus thermoaerophilus]
MIHQQILSDLDVKHIPLALIDSTYDQQAKWGMSTRHKWYKGYKLHLATTPTGIILAQELTTANVYDSDAVSD